MEVNSTGSRACANCGAEVTDQFCGHCGQHRRALDSSYALVRETVEELLSLEGRTVRTLRTLFLNPGKVTAEYLAGRRHSYTPPIRLFLGASAAFFFAFLATRSLSANYYGYTRSDSGSYVDSMSTALILLLPVAALVLRLFYPRLQRPLIHDMVFAIYSGAAAVLWMLSLTLVAAAFRAWWGHHSAAPAWLPDFVFLLYLPGLLLFAGYLASALRLVYESGWTGSILRSTGIMLVIGGVFFVVIPKILN